MPRAKPEESETEQHARFLETARALGCDEDEAAFDEKLGKIARPKPKAISERLLPEKDSTS